MSVVPVIEVPEYGTARIDGPSPDDRDVVLARRLAEQRRLRVTWLHDGQIEVAASSYVGLVRFSGIEIRIVPKLVGGSLRVLQMLDYAAGLNLIKRFDHLRDLPDEGKNLFELLCSVLAEEATQLLRDGLMRDYRPEEAALPVLRGRLDHRRQVLNRFGQLDQLECQFDEYDADNLENQYVTAALVAARTKVRIHEIRHEVSKMAGVFSTAATPRSFRADHYQQRVHYNRRNERYRPAHELASLVLRGLGFEDIYSQSSGQIFTFLLNMNDVFERFVERLIRNACDGTPLSVSSQDQFGKVIQNLATGRTYSKIRPDLMIRDAAIGVSLPVDTKYKRYDLGKLSTSDIYQTFLYAYALSSGMGEPRALLVFPAEGPISGLRLAIRSLQSREGAKVTAIGLQVPQILDAIGTQSSSDELASLAAMLAAEAAATSSP